MSIKPFFYLRWLIFLLAAGYCLRTLIFGSYDGFGGPFRYLTVWALFCSFFSMSRMMSLEEGRSEQRWDGFVCMTAVVNTMVVILYWRLYFADPNSVTRDGELAAWHLEIYMHLVGPALQVFDTLVIHRSYTRLKAAFAWLIGVIGTYLLWTELLVQPFTNTPQGTVTSGLPYPFLNSLELPDRLVFYGTNFAVAFAILLIYAGLAWVIRRQFHAPVMP